MRKIKNPYLHKEGYKCFGCCPDNPIGLHMEFFEDGDDVISFWHPQEHYQGWVGVMHGGIVASLVDETFGWVVTRKLQTAGMTSKLEIRYKHPLSVNDSQYTIHAHITNRRAHLVFMSATIENAKGEVCVEAESVYYAFDEEKAKEIGFSHCDVENEQLLSM